jgi:hypothetical protein
MKRFIYWITVAVITFFIGVAGFVAWHFSFDPPIQILDESRAVPVDEKKRSIYKLGRLEAEQDIRNGKLKYKTYGLGLDWRGEPDLYKEKLWKDYGIELIAVAGCMVSDEIVENARGYNEVSLAEVEKRYGEGILDRVLKEAGAEFEQRQKAKKRGKSHRSA